jgi:hypothetical protein
MTDDTEICVLHLFRLPRLMRYVPSPYVEIMESIVNLEAHWMRGCEGLASLYGQQKSSTPTIPCKLVPSSHL